MNSLDLRSQQRVSQLAREYNMRFEKLLLSVDDAIIAAGKKTEKQRQSEASEQNDSRRLLLVVEEIAIKKKEVAASAETAYLQRIEAEFNKALMDDLSVEFNDTPMIMEKILKFDKSVGALLDLLYTESCSISRILNCLETLPWLEVSLMQFIKQPRYRRLNSLGQPVEVITIRAALSYVGIDSLRILIPILIAKHINPLRSQYTPNIVKSMWYYTLGTGNIAKALSETYGVKPHFGYNMGLLANIGRSAVVNLYLRRFDRKLREEVIKASKKNDINKAKALSSLLPSTQYISMLWQHHANRITTNVLKALNCRWLVIAGGFEDFARIKELDIDHVNSLDLHPLAKLLFASQGFMQYKMLSNEKLIVKQEAMIYLRNFGITSHHANVISKINITGIELNIAGIIDTSEENREG